MKHSYSLAKATCLILFCFLFQKSHSQAILQWAKGFGAVGDDHANGVSLDASGNVYSCGSFSGTVDFDPGPGTFTMSSAGVNDFFVCKFTTTGTFVWAKKVGGGSDEKANAIEVDANGNSYTTGYFYSLADFDPGAGTYTMQPAGGGFTDIFVLKLDANGNFLWAKQMGGSKSDGAMDLALDGSGNVITTGYFMGNADFDPATATSFSIASTGTNVNAPDVFVSKLNSSGNFIWAKAFGSDTSDYARSITTDAAGNVYSCGVFNKTVDMDPGAGTYTMTSIAGKTDVYISKLDANGNFGWAVPLGGNQPDEVYSLVVTAAGSLFAFGTFNGLPDFDPGPGTFTMSPNNGGIYLEELNSTNGNFISAKQFGQYTCCSSGWSYWYSNITADASNNLYLTGGFMGQNVDLDPGPASYTLSSAGSSPELFVTKISASGNFLWAVQMGGAGATGMHPTGIKLDANSDIYVSGDYWGTCDFDPTPGTSTLTSGGYGDAFLIKLNQIVTGVQPLTKESELKLYPNPASDRIIVESTKENSVVLVYDALGNIVHLEKINGTRSEISISKLNAGIYFVKVDDQIRKVIRN